MHFEEAKFVLCIPKMKLSLPWFLIELGSCHWIILLFLGMLFAVWSNLKKIILSIMIVFLSAVVFWICWCILLFLVFPVVWEQCRSNLQLFVSRDLCSIFALWLLGFSWMIYSDQFLNCVGNEKDADLSLDGHSKSILVLDIVSVCVVGSSMEAVYWPILLGASWCKMIHFYR